MMFRKMIKSSLYSRYYTEACNEWRHSAWTHLRGIAPGQRTNIAAVPTMCPIRPAEDSNLALIAMSFTTTQSPVSGFSFDYIAAYIVQCTLPWCSFVLGVCLT